MRLPRLRIAHQLSLLIAASVVLAVLVVGALSVWNLRSGFNDYLQLRDEEQLTRLMKLVERYAGADPSMNWLRDDREAMRVMMDEFTGRDGRRRPPPMRPPRLQDDRPGMRGPPEFDRPPPPPPPPQATQASNIADRVLILDAQGLRLAGHELAPGLRRTVRAVKVDGVVVANIELSAEPEPEGLDARFLQRQYRGLIGAALGTILVAVMVGWWVASLWSRPLRALQRATRDIASGHRTRPLQPTGALEIAQLMEDVNRMTTELARLEDARRIWLAQISHELRSPLAVLRGELESIEDGARQPTPEVITNLREEVMQLNRLVADLQTLAMADTQGLRCEFTTGDAHTRLLRVAQRFDSRFQQRGLRLTKPDAQAKAIPARWDFGRIEQLLANLLANSLRYTDSPGEVRLTWRSDGQQLTLTVEDSAPGVSASDLTKLFEPLFRADRSRQRGTEHGSGLGLSIVRTIVQAHKGTVTASASKLGGLRVCVTLPLQAEDAA